MKGFLNTGASAQALCTLPRSENRLEWHSIHVAGTDLEVFRLGMGELPAAPGVEPIHGEEMDTPPVGPRAVSPELEAGATC